MVMDIKGLSQFVDRHARHKLLFVQGEIDNISYMDIGKELSQRISDKLDRRNLPMITDDALNAIIEKGTVADDTIGSYVAIRNWGILFEPSLMINVHDKFEQCSREQVLIVNLEGVIDNNKLYLGHEPNTQCSITLRDISYRTIYDNI